jgi:hypothetical protein
LLLRLISLISSRLPRYQYSFLTGYSSFAGRAIVAAWRKESDLLLPGNHLDTFSVTYPLLHLNVQHRRKPLFHLVLIVSLFAICHLSFPVSIRYISASLASSPPLTPRSNISLHLRPPPFHGMRLEKNLDIPASSTRTSSPPGCYLISPDPHILPEQYNIPHP